MVVNLKDMNRVAERQSDEAESKRKARAAELNRQNEQRRAAAVEAEARNRVEEQERLKAEVKGFMLAANSWMTSEDFEREWQSNKLRLVRDYQAALATVRM